MLQEWKLNFDAAAYERSIDSNMSKPSDKKEMYRNESNLYWPTSIKYTIQWFPCPIIMEHTTNILKPYKCIISSLLKFFHV